jgi:hypothetical protein
MSGRGAEIRALKACWSCWVDVVELFARERIGRHRVNPEAYRMLHKDLLEQCRSLARSGGDGDSAFYSRLEELAQPWISSAVLARAEPEILGDLLSRCRDAQRRLGGRRWLSTGSHQTVSVILMLLFGVMAIAIVMSATDTYQPALERLREALSQAVLAAKRTSELERLLLASLAVIAFGIVAVGRTARR